MEISHWSLKRKMARSVTDEDTQTESFNNPSASDAEHMHGLYVIHYMKNSRCNNNEGPWKTGSDS